MQTSVSQPSTLSAAARRVSVVAAIALVLASLVGVVAPQQAKAESAPVIDYAAEASPGTIGSVNQGNRSFPARCLHGEALTGVALTGTASGAPAGAAEGVDLICTEILSEPNYHLGETNSYGDVSFGAYAQTGALSPSIARTSCPAGSVMTALSGAVDTALPSGAIGISGLTAQCQRLLSNGFLQTNLQGTVDGQPSTTGFYGCSPLNVIDGVTIYNNTDGSVSEALGGDDVDGIAPYCVALNATANDSALVFSHAAADGGLTVPFVTPNSGASVALGSLDVQNFRVSAQISWDGSAGTEPIFSRPDAGAPDAYRLYLNNGKPCFDVGTSPVRTVCSTSTVPVGAWVELTASYTNSQVAELDVDAVPTRVDFGSPSGITYTTPNAPQRIGSEAGVGTFGGAIDDVGFAWIVDSDGDPNPYERFSFETPGNSAGSYLDAEDGFQANPVDPNNQPQLANHADLELQNYSWPTARTLNPTDTVFGSVLQPGQDRWYKVPISPDGSIKATVSQLAFNGDVTLFSDIGQAFNTLTSQKDLTKLQADFAPSAFSPSAFSPSAFSPSAFSPSAFSPSAFSPSAFSPSAFSSSLFAPSAFSPSAFSPSAFSPSAFSPSAFSPSAFSPSAFSPSAFSPSAFSPSAFSPSAFSAAFSSAQVRSLLEVAPGDGTADRTVSANTWNNTGYYYIRVQGRDGAATPQPFQLSVTTTSAGCTGPLNGFASDSTLTAPAAAANLVVTDSARFAGTDPGNLMNSLNALAASTGGTVVDVNNSQKVRDLFAQADGTTTCVYAENLAAQAIRDIINSYRDSSGGTLKTVTLAGGDRVIPFFRYPDAAGLAPESGYVPPLISTSADAAALGTSDILSQVAYGSTTDVTIKGSTLPIADVSVGRLVESYGDVESQIANYTASGGQTITPTSSLTTGYDFLADDATQVAGDLSAGIGGSNNDTLITNDGVNPANTTVNGTPSPTTAWTATDLRKALFTKKHDIVFLAGHFSANDTLAADFSTDVVTTEVAPAVRALPGLFTNTLIFSPGCHSAYNLQDEDAIPNETLPLDWAQALTEQGATLLGGTGYQYGDTDFVEYSEALYGDFARELRTGTGPVAVGAALLAAEQDYLGSVTTITGMDQKAYLEATLYGIPTKAVNETGTRITAPAMPPVGGTAATITGPGTQLGLTSTSVTLNPSTAQATKPVDQSNSPGANNFTYSTGPNGVDTTPGAPVLPLATYDATQANTVLRGVGFRSGTYTDSSPVLPLTGAPATEINAAHPSFASPVQYPQSLATANYFGALAGGKTELQVTPAQYVTSGSGPLAIQRTYSQLGYQLYYDNNITTYNSSQNGVTASNTPALAAPPQITQVTAAADTTPTFAAHVTGDPSAGIGDVWVTYTATSGPLFGTWQSFDLTQAGDDTTLWSGGFTLPNGQDPSTVRYVVQAVNGVGEVSQDNNGGYYYSLGVPAGVTSVAAATPSTLTLGSAPTAGHIGDQVTATATLTGPASASGNTVTFTLGNASATGTTDSNGVASVTLPVTGPPGSYLLSAAFAGDSVTNASQASPVTVAVTPETTSLAISAPANVTSGTSSGVSAMLTAGARNTALNSEAITFTASDGTHTQTVVSRTNLQGVASFGTLTGMTPGTITFTASFAGPAVDATYGASSADASSSFSASLAAVSGGGQTTTVGTTYNNPVAVKVTDTSGNPVSGATVKFLPTGLSFAGAASDGSVTVTTGSSGLATTPTITAGTVAGTQKVTARMTGTSDVVTSLTATAGAAATITVSSGSGQKTAVTAAYSAPLAALVTDAYGNPVSGSTVTFTAPGSGATATFGSSATATATSGSNGIATSSTPTAGKSVGSYSITATTASKSTGFTESNIAGPPADIYAYGLPVFATRAGTNDAPLGIQVTDSNGNPVVGTTVTFTAPTSGATVTFGGAATTTAVTNTQGVATSSTPLANTTEGSFHVTVTTGSAKALSLLGINTYATTSYAAPVDDPISSSNPMSVFAIGGTVPVSIQLLDPSNKVVSDTESQNLLKNGKVSMVLIDLGTTSGATSVKSTGTATPDTGASYRYNTATHAFVYNLQGRAAGAKAGHSYTLDLVVTDANGVPLAGHLTTIGFT